MARKDMNYIQLIESVRSSGRDCEYFSHIFASAEGIYKALCQAYYAGIDNGYRQAIRDAEKARKAKGTAVSSKALVSIADSLGTPAAGRQIFRP